MFERQGSWTVGKVFRSVTRIGFVSIALAALATIPAQVLAQSTATVQFGNPSTAGRPGNPGNSPCVTGGAGIIPDQCANAFHKMIPGSVNISAPGTVNFQYDGRHHVAVYSPGKGPNDVTFTPGTNVNDPVGLFASGPNVVGGTHAISFPAGTPSGRYLVICRLATHFEDNMWGWIQVQ
jgi:hypothetical protein